MMFVAFKLKVTCVIMAGAGGFEPPYAGIKNLCLNRLTTPQFVFFLSIRSIPRPTI